jgi:tripartite-type tricarboxylate transporter receptor subunit TctC
MKTITFPALLLLLLAIGAVEAQGYPARPVRAVVGFAAGGQIDAITRIVTAKMSEGLKQPIVVENRPGAGSSIATELVARSTPDGYTVYFATNSVAVNHVLTPRTAPDPVKSFTPVSLIATAESVLLVNAGVPVKSVSELIAWAKKAGNVNYATTGLGTPAYLGMEFLKYQTGMRAQMVLYKDVGQAGADAASGRVQLWMTLLTPSLPLIQAGKLRPLAVSGPKRMSSLPEVPTFREIGFPTLQAASWYSILVPVGTAREPVARLAAEAKRALGYEDVKQKLATLAIEPAGSPAAEVSRVLNDEMERIRLLVKLGVLKPE